MNLEQGAVNVPCWKQGGVMLSPLTDEVCFVVFFQSIVLTLKKIGMRAGTGFDV